MKKTVMVLFSLVLCISVLAGCGSNSAGNSNNTGKAAKSSGKEAGSTSKSKTDTATKSVQNVTIQFWHSQTQQDRVAKIGDLIKKFESENKGITVKQVPLDENDFTTKIVAAMSANKLPAVIEGGLPVMQLVGSQGVVNTSANAKIINQFQDIYKGALATLKNPNGSGYIGVPLSGWVQGIWYNKALFKKKGLQPPTTWDNILKAAKALNDPGNHKYGIVIGKAADDFTEQTFSQFALSNNAHVFGKDGKPDFNTPAMVEALKFYKELSKYSSPGASSWRDAHDLYLSGNAAMMMYSTYIMSDLSKKPELAQNTGFAIPENKVKASFGNITGITVTNTVSKQQSEAAQKFITFLMQKDNNIKYQHIAPGGANPVRQSVASDPAYLNNDVLKVFGKTAAQIPDALANLQRFGLQNGKNNPLMGDISAKLIISKAINNMTEHGSSAKDVAKKAQGEMMKVAQSK